MGLAKNCISNVSARISAFLEEEKIGLFISASGWAAGNLFNSHLFSL